MTSRRDRVTPGPGQESVWDYPRPPGCVPSDRHVEVRHGSAVVADSHGAFRVLETTHPPTWYIPPADITIGALARSTARGTICEYKGVATYWDVVVDGARLAAVAWSYEEPWPGYEAITGYVSFLPARVECFIDGERVRPQEGGFYGGWITDDVVGPFKGGAGTLGW